MKRSLFLLTALVASMSLSAQRTIKGKLTDSETHNRIRGASVSIKSQQDQTFSRYSISDTAGNFIFSNLDSGKYELFISYIGYRNYSQVIKTDSGTTDLGNLGITRIAGMLDSVTVLGKTPMAEQKGDTFQLNASQFKVNPDATVEDLAKKMPGITIQNGQVTAHGETVQKVTLDGRDFFGDDATAALKNLPAEIVDKIQIFDRLSDQAQFTGYDDGNTVKAINIVTKANMRNGQFGRVFAGYGTDNRYQAGGNTTILKDKRKISLVGNFNNVNTQNFSTQDLLGVTSSGSRGGGGGRGGGGYSGGGYGGGGASNFLVGQQNGINRTTAAGINYSDSWGPKINFTGSYFFNDTHNSTDQLVNRHYVQPGIPNYTQTTASNGDNINHRVSMRFEYKIDSANQLIITPSLSFQRNNSFSMVGTTIFRADSTNASKTNNINRSDRNGNNLNNSIVYRHAFPKRGRSFSVNFQTGYNKKAGNVYTDFYDTTYSGTDYTDSISQRHTNQLSDGYQVSANFVYTEPLSRASQLQVNYNPSYTKSKADQEAFELDDNSGKYSLFNPSLSNKFNNNTKGQNAGLGYRFNTKSTQLNIGVNYQHSELSSDQQFPRTLSVNKSFDNILPNAMFRFKLNTRSNFRFLYRVNTNNPSVTQLADIYDYTNLPFVVAGNPNLEQQLMQSLSGRYTYTNSNSNTLFVGNVFMQTANNYITNATYVPLSDSVLTSDLTLAAGQQLTKPVNLNGYLSLRSFLTFAMPLNFIKSNINLNGGVSYQKLPGILNSRNNISRNYTYSLGAVIGSNISQYVDFTVSYNANINTVKNELQPTLNNHYFSQSAGVQFNLLAKNGWFLQNDLTNQLYNGLSAGFNQNYFLWNMAAGKKIFKKQQGELKLSVFDLLKQNRSIVRNVTETYIEDVQNQVLRQYFMLTFTYNLRNFGTAASRGPGSGFGPGRGFGPGFGPAGNHSMRNL